jgi:peptide/nickel transport system ATP-binding protein
MKDRGPQQAAEPLLSVKDLRVSFRTRQGVVAAVRGVSFEVYEGEVLGIVGESGSGKSVTMMSVLGLLNNPNVQIEGEVRFRGESLIGLNHKALQGLRGGSIAMIFQDPMTSLTPVYTVGWQIQEQLRVHTDLTRRQARARTVELLDEVGIPSPERRYSDYPHQFSGGMRQRVMIAMALSCEPALLIADEPTTALDVTVQAQILELMSRLQREHGSAIILITHDMGVVSQMADRVHVMYAGRFVERGTRNDVFLDPEHPYTWGLLGSIPHPERPRPRRLPTILGSPPSPLNVGTGCAFAPRCRFGFDACAVAPELPDGVAQSHGSACWLAPEQLPELRRPILRPWEDA